MSTVPKLLAFCNIKMRESQGSSLTDAAPLGGTTFPELVTVQPLGSPAYVVGAATVLVWSVVAPATHG